MVDVCSLVGRGIDMMRDAKLPLSAEPQSSGPFTLKDIRRQQAAGNKPNERFK